MMSPISPFSTCSQTVAVPVACAAPLSGVALPLQPLQPQPPTISTHIQMIPSHKCMLVQANSMCSTPLQKLDAQATCTSYMHKLHAQATCTSYMHELTQAAHAPLQCTAALRQTLTRYRSTLLVTTCMWQQSVADTDVDESQAV